MAWAFLRLMLNPQDTNRVFDIGESLYQLGKFEYAKKIFLADPANAQLVNSRKLLKNFNLQELKKLPEGSLGRSYADHMIRLNLDPEFFREMETTQDVGYIIMRMRQTHDWWHIMTGFDTSVPGEISLQTFYATQVGLPIHAVLVGLGFLRAGLKEPSLLPQLLQAVQQGYALGKKAKPLFPFDWEANWDRALSDLRTEMGLN